MLSRRRFAIIAALFIGFVVGGHCAALSEARAADAMGALSDVLPQGGQEAPWRYDRPAGGFVIENRDDPYAIQYFYIGAGDQSGGRNIDATVALAPGGQGGAGLLYAFDDATRHYFAITVETTGEVKVWRRDGNGFNEAANFGPRVDPGAPTRLTIEETAGKAALYLNGDYLGALEGPEIGRGGVGVIAGGVVSARFSAFSDGRPGAPSPAADLGSPTAAPVTTPVTAPVRAAAAALPDGALVLEPVQVIDQTAPFGPTPAFSTYVPRGWKTEGGVVWNPANGCHRGGELIWGASSPDDAYGIGFAPPISWGASNYGGTATGCLQMDLPDAASAAQAYLQLSPDLQAKVLGVEQNADMATLVRQLSSQIVPLPNVQSWVDGVVLRISVVDEGRPAEAFFITLTHHWRAATPDGWGQGGMLISTGGVMEFALVVKAPPGKLDAGHPGFDAILGNLRADPRWNQRVAQWWASQRRPVSTGGGAGTSGGSSVSDMMFESWKRREGMNDAGQSAAVNGILEVENFQTSQGAVALSQNYANTWELGNGVLVQTNDANFNPMQTFNEFGTQLAPTR